MALWHNTSRAAETGKFQPVRRMGIERHGSRSCGQYTYHFIRCGTGSTVRRSLYHVAIVDPHGARVGYLMNFCSPHHAAIAARKWIGMRGKPSLPMRPSAVNRASERE